MPVDNSDYLDPDGFTSGYGTSIHEYLELMTPQAKVEIRRHDDEENKRWILNAQAEGKLVTFGLTFPAWESPDTCLVHIHYRTSLNGDWHNFPEIEIESKHVEQYLAHMGKLGLAAVGVHNGPHNQLVASDHYSKEETHG